MMKRDTSDERARRRLASGYALSLVIHALAALLFFSVVTSSSDQSAQEANQESATIAVSRSVARPRTHAEARTAVPPPHAPVSRFHAQHPVIAHQRMRTLHELAKIVAHGPSNAKPVPLASALPVPAPNEPELVPRPQQSIVAVPLSLPSTLPMASLKTPPTAAPTEEPTKAPASPVPHSPVPAVAAPKPSPAPVTPAPAASATTVAVLTAAPAKTPGPSRISATPAPRRVSGFPSAAPTGPISSSRGTEGSPGPKAAASPRTGAITSSAPKSAPPKPIQVAPTASPQPKRTAAGAGSAPYKRKAYRDLNARLKGLIPNSPVTYSQKRVSPGASAVHEAEPTPPPEVLARTKFIYRSGSLSSEENKLFGGSFRSERLVIGYVTALDGSTCTGWVIRYPRAPDRYGQVPGPFRPGAVNYPGPQGENGFRPIIEPDVSFRCNPKLLTPYSAPSSVRLKNP